MIKFEPSTPGSWATFDILVNDVKKFFASKQGTNFWVVVDADYRDNGITIGSATGRPEVLALVKEYLKNDPTG